MKKLYSKPDISFEDFSMSTNIAAGCEKKPINEKGEVQWGNYKIFTSSMNCTKKIIDGESAYNGLCYHNPSDNFNVFYS